MSEVDKKITDNAENFREIIDTFKKSATLKSEE